MIALTHHETVRSKDDLNDPLIEGKNGIGKRGIEYEPYSLSLKLNQLNSPDSEIGNLVSMRCQKRTWLGFEPSLTNSFTCTTTNGSAHPAFVTPVSKRKEMKYKRKLLHYCQLTVSQGM